jgi:hypothetical protein
VAHISSWVLSLEINPLMATARGCIAVDALAQLKTGEEAGAAP